MKNGENNKGDQLKINFPSKNVNGSQPNTGKIVNINQHSVKTFASFIVKNSKSF
jgi:hypothetical protein